jgi:hypothetical protein
MSVAILETLPEPIRKPRPPFKPRSSKYPFESMQVGQGFFATAKGIASTVARAAKKLGHKYTTYHAEVEGVHGRVVKRVE